EFDQGEWGGHRSAPLDDDFEVLARQDERAVVRAISLLDEVDELMRERALLLGVEGGERLVHVACWRDLIAVKSMFVSIARVSHTRAKASSRARAAGPGPGLARARQLWRAEAGARRPVSLPRPRGARRS